jgi:hypothetical protein
VFGGLNGSANVLPFGLADSVVGDLWTLNLTSLVWESHAPQRSPPPRAYQAAAVIHGKVVMHGGLGQNAVVLSDTWSVYFSVAILGVSYVAWLTGE